MKKTILALIMYGGLQCAPWNGLKAQTPEENTRLFRFYEDNDFINIRGEGTDQGYTNGTRFDLFYTRETPARNLPDRWMPRAGKESVNTYGWGFMQMMFTPEDISRVKPATGDFSYAGALFITHTLHSANPLRKYNIQTEWMAGVIGPWALAKETQTYAHQLLSYQKPMGWDNQINNKLLLNLNLTAEKQLYAYRGKAEIMAGSQLYAGTMLNGLSVYSLIRIGKMAPYFNGYLTQYSSTAAERKKRFPWQLYLTVRPGAELMLSNALVKETVSTDDPPAGPYVQPTFARRKLLAAVDYGMVAVYRNLGFSLSQKTISPVIRGLPHLETGNISFYLSW